MKLFECGIRYEKTMENGMQKKVTELYIVDALSFTEAESRIIGEMSCFISGEFDVVSEKITNYSELVSTDNTEADKWYKVKINLITLDEKTMSEKKQPLYLLVQAHDIDDARSRLNEHMKSTMADWVCEAVQETKIMDVFLYAPDAPHKKAQTYEDKVIQEAAEAVADSPSCQRAAKRFIDGIPDGQKVTISVPGGHEFVIGKTHDHKKVQDDA